MEVALWVACPPAGPAAVRTRGGSKRVLSLGIDVQHPASDERVEYRVAFAGRQPPEFCRLPFGQAQARPLAIFSHHTFERIHCHEYPPDRERRWRSVLRTAVS